jgi:maltooligosyltrehalose trehalohydrolase
MAVTGFGIEPGAIYLGNGNCRFRVWAPRAKSISVEIASPRTRRIPLAEAGGGYWESGIDQVEPGATYKYRFDDARLLPDPASRCQPEGVHGPSQVTNPAFNWTDSHWHGIAIEEYILYELHVGTFTAEGTFDAAIRHLPYLKDLGITAIELMPVVQFPGPRNWGYDGVYPYAVQTSYGGPERLKAFVDAAHEIGLAVVLDVVYNHLGPEGNYLDQFGPYFTDRYQTPWGQAVNFDGLDSAPVREYFIQNALYWIREFHIDGLRLDAVHAIFDNSERHILADIAAAVHEIGRRLHRTINVIAESDLNEARIVMHGEAGGYGLDAQWSDDFHHSVHSVMTGERSGYYEDFGLIEDLARALSAGFVFSGQYSNYRGRCHGTDCSTVPGRAFVVCIQNHDQIGNRMMGERLSHLITADGLKVAAAILLLSPFVPLLFMGQEYAETSPFLYFVSHGDPGLVEAVREGRKREFASFEWRGEVPDAQSEETFLRSKLKHDLRNRGWHAQLLEWYRTLISMRKRHPSLARLDRDRTTVNVEGAGQVLVMRRWSANEEIMAIFNVSDASESLELPVDSGPWQKILDSGEERWAGPGTVIPSCFNIEDRELVSLNLRPKQCVVFASGVSRDQTPVRIA